MPIPEAPLAWADPRRVGRGMDDPRRRERQRQAEAFLAMGRILRTLEARAARLLVDEGLTNVTYAQANALMALFQAREPLTARQLADHLGVSEASTSRLVGALVEHGWVDRERDPRDGRAWILRPTERARERLPAFARVFNTLMDQAFDGFDRSEQRAIGGFVARIHQNLEPEDGGAR